MSNRKTFSLSFFLGRAFFLGFGFSLILSTTNKDSWICFILGTIIGILFVYFISKIKDQMKELTLKEYLRDHKILKYIILIVFFLFNFFLLEQILFILETFASSFFLIKSPPYFILAPIILLIFIATKNSWHTIGRLGEILMPFSLVIIVVTLLILVPYLNFDHFTPILTTPTTDIIKNTLFFAFYSSAPFLLLLNAPMKETKLVRKYLLSTLTIVLIGVFIIAVIGPNLIQIYRYPEYMILKKIKAFQFLEKIENIISVTWIIDLIMISIMAGNNIRATIPKKKNSWVFGFILFLIAGIVIVSSRFYRIDLEVYYILPIVLGVFEIILIILFWIFQKRKKKKTLDP